MKQDLRRFITENFMFGMENVKLSDEDSLVEKGLIDSTGILELVAFLQIRRDLRVRKKDLFVFVRREIHAGRTEPRDTQLRGAPE